jgi:uncharacterized protein
MAAEARQVPWRGRDVLFTFLIGLGMGVVLGVIVTIALQAADVSEVVGLSVGTAMIYGGLVVGIYLRIMRRYDLSFRDLGFAGVPFGTLALMVPVYIAMAIFIGLVMTAIAPLLGDPPTSREQLALPDGGLSVAVSIVVAIDAAVIAPFVEELLFRGLLYGWLRSRWGVVPAVIVSSALFAVAHPYPPLMPALFAMGAVLAYVYERYKSLYPAVLLHGIQNGLAVLVIALS